MIFLPAPDVCADLKNRSGCGPGSQREKFMKKHCRKTCGLCNMLVLVTGGWGEGGRLERRLDSVELLNMDGTWNCPMSPLPKPTYTHTQTGPIVCGGDNGSGMMMMACFTFISGDVNWEKTHTLAKPRWGHSAWASPQGIMMLGGWDNRAWTTSEILLENGDTKLGFRLKYDTQ